MTTKPNDLKENVKSWDIEACVWYLVSQGMYFMANRITKEELNTNEKIIANHLKSLQEPKEERYKR